MPKGCYDCPLLDGEYGYCTAGATGLYSPYRDDCPLTEVKEPHGRLIDAEMLMEYCNNTKAKNISNNDIARFPTVIERSTMSEETKEILCDNYACLYCVNDTCTRKPNEGTVEAEISGKRDRDCLLTWR